MEIFKNILHRDCIKSSLQIINIRAENKKYTCGRCTVALQMLQRSDYDMVIMDLVILKINYSGKNILLHLDEIGIHFLNIKTKEGVAINKLIVTK